MSSRALLTPALYGGELIHLLFRKQLLLPTQQKTGWTPEVVWVMQRSKKSEVSGLLGYVAVVWAVSNIKQFKKNVGLQGVKAPESLDMLGTTCAVTPSYPRNPIFQQHNWEPQISQKNLCLCWYYCMGCLSSGVKGLKCSEVSCQPGFRRKWVWTNLRNIPALECRDWGKPQHSVQIAGVPSWDSNQTSPKCKFRVLQVYHPIWYLD